MAARTLRARDSRLARTSTFRFDGVDRWCDGAIFVNGVGNLGQRVSLECVQSGAHLIICDPGRAKDATLLTQFGQHGSRKIDTVTDWVANTAAGSVVGHFCDVRHVGVGQIAAADLIIDCSDDPRLAQPLTTISNGLGIPLLRAALDGSGESEMGRVSCSHGGGGYACQLCTYELRDLLRHTERTPCQPNGADHRRPTLAGGAIGTTVAGITVLQAQRLITGNDQDKVFDQEWIIDLTSGQLLPVKRRRSADCLSGHVRWNLMRLPLCAEETTWGELFAEAQRCCGRREITLEPFTHAVCTEAICQCGDRRSAVGTRWAVAPKCDACGEAMQWVQQSSRHRLTPRDIAELNLSDTRLLDTGLPESGALCVARTEGKPPIRFVLS